MGDLEQDTSHCDLLRRSGFANRLSPWGLRSLAVRNVGCSRLRRRQPEQLHTCEPDRRSRTCGAGRIEHGALLASVSSQLLSTPVPPA